MGRETPGNQARTAAYANTRIFVPHLAKHIIPHAKSALITERGDGNRPPSLLFQYPHFSELFTDLSDDPGKQAGLFPRLPESRHLSGGRIRRIKGLL